MRAFFLTGAVNNAAGADVAGSAWHCYAGDPGAQSVVRNAQPAKDIFFTECSGSHGATDTPEQYFRGTLTWHARLQPTDAGWVDLATKSPLISSAALQALGWKPQHSGTEAITELVTAMREGEGDEVYPPLHGR